MNADTRHLVRGCLVVAVICAVVVSVRVVWVGRQIAHIRRETHEFEAATGYERLAGKTPDEVIAILGKPYWDTRKDTTRPSGTFQLGYKSRQAEYAGITFADGKVAEVKYWSQ